MDIKELWPLFQEEKFLDLGYCPLSESISFDVYKAQVNSGNIGTMEYLKKHLANKDPKNQSLNSAFVALHPYYPQNNKLKSSLRTALYAQDEDYHKEISKKLKRISDKLMEIFPNHIFEYSVDSKPVLERDLAFRAGLGWIGKNTCLLNREHGSLFYIAEILSDLKLDQKTQIQTDHCGNCTKCIDACPTNALQPRKMIVERCISYRTIESKSYDLDELSAHHESWFFGCDICQTVCPWNEKAHNKQSMAELTRTPEIEDQQVEELNEILISSNGALERKYSSFPLSRARGKGLKRNALNIIYENKIVKLIPRLEKLKFKDQLETLRHKVLIHLKK